MDLKNAYLVDRFDMDLPPIHIFFYKLIFKSIDVGVYLKIDENFLKTSNNFSIWIPTQNRELIHPDNPPLLNHTNYENQLYPDHVNEIKLLFDEALMTGNVKEISENVYEIVIFDYRRGYNFLNREHFKNRWTVYGGSSVPDKRIMALGTYHKQIRYE